MRRRRKGRRLRKKVVVWFVVFVDVLAAVYASRLTAVRHVDVSGVPAYDEARVRQILASLSGIPNSRVNAAQVETEVMREPSVRYAQLRTNMIGNGSMRIVYRKPVARLEGSSNLALDADGVVYAAPDLPSGLTPLQLPPWSPPTLVGVAGNWQAQRLAWLADDVRTLGPPGSVEIQVDQEGAICLNIGSGRVMLGSADDLDRKMKVLRLRLEKNREELSQIQELILTHPDSPAIIKRNIDRKQVAIP